jgi:hypothetical protein
VLRRLAFVPLGLLAASSAYQAPTGWGFQLAAAAQASFYALAGLGFLLRRRRLGRLKPVYIPFYYCMANAAAALAFVHLLSGRRVALWQPQRHASAAGSGRAA